MKLIFHEFLLLCTKIGISIFSGMNFLFSTNLDSVKKTVPVSIFQKLIQINYSQSNKRFLQFKIYFSNFYKILNQQVNK